MFNSIISSLRRVSVVALAAFILSAISPAAWAEGEDYNFPGLGSTVTVYEDILGIPTIVGETENDVSFVLGYLHARDRFFTMDAFRKQVAGRLAELVGSAALSSDIQARTIGMGRAALASWQRLSPETKGVLQSYANGVNTYLRNGPLPPEYVGLELTATDPWMPLDTLLVAKGLALSLSLDTDDANRTQTLLTYQGFGDVIGFDGVALFFEDTHRTAPADDRVSVPGFLGSIGGFGQSFTEAEGNGNKPAANVDYSRIPRVSEELGQLVSNYLDQVDNAPYFKAFLQSAEKMKGSNSWAISGAHTESGYPIVANDPHLGLTTPPIWYEAQLIFKRGDSDWQVSGVSLPGTAGIVIGCNNFACWGYTVNPMDVTDIFQDQTIAGGAFPFPTHTVHDGVEEPIQQIYQSYFVNAVGDETTDNISRANVGLDAGGLTFVVPRRNNGPIISPGDGTALTLQYAGMGPTFEAEWIRQTNLARSLEEYKEASQYFDVGNQNAMYADRDGNIAYFTIAENPIREDMAAGTVEGLPPYFIRDGSGALNNEWLPVQNPQPHQALPFEIMPFDEMPQVVNPASGYIANANQDPIGTSLDNDPLNQLRPGGTNGLYYLSPGYADGYRMGRIDREIQKLIASGEPITMEDIMELQGNAQLLDAELVLPMLMPAFDGLALPPEHPMAQALDVLSTWDYSTPTGLAEGYDAGDDPFLMVEPDMAEIRNSAAATIFAALRARLIANTIDATLTAVGLGGELPGSTSAWNAFKHHLENFPERGGIGASGLPFFSAGFEATIQGSLQQALEMLASEEFAPAFEISQNVMDYRWGKLHRIVFDHPLGIDPFNIPNGGGYMDLAPGLPGIARQGGYSVVDASGHSARADTLNGFMFGSGPSRRFIASMGPDRVYGVQVLPGGQNGIFLHPNYSSQLPLWLTNNYHPMAQGEEDAIANAFMMYTMGPPVSQLESVSDTFIGVSPLRREFQPDLRKVERPKEGYLQNR